MFRACICALLAIAYIALSATSAEAAKGDKPKMTAEDKFQKKDSNNDGKLSLDEFRGKASGEKAAHAETSFKKADADNDGSLTLAEYKNVQHHKKKKQA